LDRGVDVSGLLDAAAANNAAWCDAVCRSHGHPGAFGSRRWASPGHRLRFYPNVVTLDPGATEAEAVAAAPPSGPFAVKDSFARLDLAPAGFRLLAEASWIGADGAPGGPPEDGRAWEKITSPGELGAWEAAWAGVGRDDGDSGDDGDGGGPLFRPALLADPRCAVLARRRDGAVIAGAIAYAAGGGAGISNLFAAGPAAPGRLWDGLRRAVAGRWPGLPAVGYEEGASLAAARQAGFRALGPLRIWVRP
jgi:hypothetical protein